MAELRKLRDEFQDVELGLSYARRVVQGRADIIGAEIGRRSGLSAAGGAGAGTTQGSSLLGLVPDVLADRGRGPGSPRPTRDIEPPPWADDILDELDEAISPSELAGLEHLGSERIRAAAVRVRGLEREISAARVRLHRRIGRIEDELVGRYRAGASVDDLLG